MRRLASAAVLVAVLLLTLWWLPPSATLGVAVVAAAVAGDELARIGRHLGAPISPVYAGVASAVLVAAFVAAARPGGGGAELVLAVLAALVVAAGVLTLAGGEPSPSSFTQAAALVMVPTYVGVPLGALVWIQTVHGPAATTWLIAVIAVSDSAQYYTGRAFGRRRLAPTVSPGKTVEGAVGGCVVAAMAGIGLATIWLPGVRPAAAGVLALVLALFGIAGDLFESLVKRSAGVKDSSTLIPGHGGVLDRLDSHLFAAPAFFVFLRYLA